MKTTAEVAATEAFWAKVHAICPLTRDRVYETARAYEAATGRWPTRLLVSTAGLTALAVWAPAPVREVCGLAVSHDPALDAVPDALATCA